MQGESLDEADLGTLVSGTHGDGASTEAMSMAWRGGYWSRGIQAHVNSVE